MYFSFLKLNYQVETSVKNLKIFSFDIAMYIVGREKRKYINSAYLATKNLSSHVKIAKLFRKLKTFNIH